MDKSVAYPGFPWGERRPLRGAKLLFAQFFPQNCMKMKKIYLGGGGGVASGANITLRYIELKERESESDSREFS